MKVCVFGIVWHIYCFFMLCNNSNNKNIVHIQEYISINIEYLYYRVVFKFDSMTQRHTLKKHSVNATMTTTSDGWAALRHTFTHYLQIQMEDHCCLKSSVTSEDSLFFSLVLGVQITLFFSS